MVTAVARLIIFVTFSRAVGFHPSVQKVLPFGGRSSKSLIRVSHLERFSFNQRNYHRLFASEGEDEEENDPKDTLTKRDENGALQIKVTNLLRAEVLGYRFALLFTSLGFGVSAAASLLDGTGLAAGTQQALQETSNAIIGWGACVAALLAPPFRSAATDSENDDFLNALLLFLNEALPTLGSFALIIELINTIQRNLSAGEVSELSLSSSENLDKAAGVFLAAICCREILFYGVSFKVEAVLAIIFIVLQTLDLGLSQSVCLGGLALSLLVLSIGKVFEPIRSDLVPDQSAFFLDD